MGNVGINSVGTESVYQTGQASRTECLAGVSREGLTLRIPVMCKVYASFHRMLSRDIPAKTLQSSIA